MKDLTLHLLHAEQMCNAFLSSMADLAFFLSVHQLVDKGKNINKCPIQS